MLSSLWFFFPPLFLSLSFLFTKEPTTTVRHFSIGERLRVESSRIEKRKLRVCLWSRGRPRSFREHGERVGEHGGAYRGQYREGEEKWSEKDRRTRERERGRKVTRCDTIDPTTKLYVRFKRTRSENTIGTQCARDTRAARFPQEPRSPITDHRSVCDPCVSTRVSSFLSFLSFVKFRSLNSFS